MPDPCEPPDPGAAIPYDVGVLVVHGIGTQSAGSTLKEFVDPVVKWLSKMEKGWPAGGGVDGQPRMLPAPATGMVGIQTPALGGKTQNWLVAEAWWADAFDPPDRSELSRWLVDAASWFPLFFVARLWRRFRVRPWQAAAGLLAAAGIATLLCAATTSEVEGWHWAAFGMGLGVVAASSVLPRSNAAAAIVAASLLVIYPLASLAAVGMVVMWVLGLVPGKVGAGVRQRQLSLARSVGDSYALISSARRERAMFDAITDAARKLAARLDAEPGGNCAQPPRPLVVAAHSQGAALMYRLLRRTVDPREGLVEVLRGRKITLVTHGAGILPLHVLERRLRHASWWARLTGLAGLIGLVLFAFTLGRVAADSVDDVTVATTIASVVLVGSAFAAVRRDEHRSDCPGIEVAEKQLEPPPSPDDHPAAQEPVALIGPVPQSRGVRPTGRAQVDPVKWAVCPVLPAPPGGELRWVDLWAPWDAVPNGPLDLDQPYHDSANPFSALPSTGPAFLPCRAVNNHQPWQDHVVYRVNDEEVVTRWVGEIALRVAGAGGFEPSMVEPDTPVGRTRSIRKARCWLGVSLLLLQGAILLTGLVAVVNRWGELDDLGRWLQRRFPGPLKTVSSTATDLVPEAVRDIVFGKDRDPAQLQGLVAAVVAVVLAAAAVAAVQSGWRRANSSAVAGTGSIRGRSWWIWAVLTAAVFLGFEGLAVTLADPGAGGDSTRVTVELHLEPAVDGSLGPDGVVTLQPAGSGEDAKVEVEVSDGDATLRLDDERTYVVTATAVGGKDCKVAGADRGDTIDLDDGDTLTVECASAGAVVETGP